MYGARAISTNGGKEILGFETVSDVVELFTVAGEEDGTGTWAVADSYNVALDVGGAIWGGGERLVVAAGPNGGVGYRGFVTA